MKAIGLVSNLKPSMRHTKEGDKLLTKSRRAINSHRYGENYPQVDEESSEEEEKPAADLNGLFPQIKPVSDSIIEKTKRKLKHDEIAIVEKLLKKHGQKNFAGMSRDIKLNYLQWSKGQCRTHVTTYFDKYCNKSEQ